MNLTIITGVVVVFAIYFGVSHFYFLKKLGIKNKMKGVFSKGRNRYFRAIDFIIIISFVFVIMGLVNGNHPFASSEFFVLMSLAGLFILTSINQGIEEWLLFRVDKAYYYTWLNTVLYVGILLIFVLEDQNLI